MEATRLFPNYPPAVLRQGLTGSLALPPPDCVPLEPAVLDDTRLRARRAVAVDAVGALRLHVRNREGYAFLRARPDMMMSEGPFDKLYATKNAKDLWYGPAFTYFRLRNDQFLPRTLVLRRFVEQDQFERAQGPVSARQSNAIAGASIGSDGSHVVFFPTGQILQRACAFFSSNDGGAHPSGGFASNAVETGAVIRQFSVMGRTNDYRPFGAEDVMVAARGEANCTILSVAMPSARDPKPRMRRKTKLQFSESVNHVAASPHTGAELAFTTSDGAVHYWDPDTGLQVVESNFSVQSYHILRCEYSSHPCVLWTASKKTVETMDLRASTAKLRHTTKLFDITAVQSPLAEIFDIKRRSRSPFQFIVASGLATEIIDTRMARMPLISWGREQASDTEALKFGAVEELDMPMVTYDDRGAVITISARPKVATLYPFERSQKRARQCPTLTLQPLLYNDEDGEQASMSGSQYVTTDAPLDLRMADGGEDTHLIGICPLRDDPESSSARVYMFNTLGDLYSQRVAWSSGTKTKPYTAAVQPGLPCGMAVQDEPSTSRGTKRKLPIPVDAILPEYPADDLLGFTTLKMRALLRKYPHVESIEGVDDTGRHVGKKYRTISDDEEGLADKLHRVCQPSATLFQLHRYVTDEIGVLCSSRELLRFLSARAEFSIQTAHHRSIRSRRFRVVNTRNRADSENREHIREGDPRVSTCRCSIDSSLWPCESLACVLPHSLVVCSRMNGVAIEDVLPESERHPTPSPEYAKVILAAREAFNQFEPSD